MSKTTIVNKTHTLTLVQSIGFLKDGGSIEQAIIYHASRTYTYYVLQLSVPLLYTVQ